jgi:hypothetical protein
VYVNLSNTQAKNFVEVIPSDKGLTMSYSSEREEAELEAYIFVKITAGDIDLNVYENANPVMFNNETRGSGVASGAILRPFLARDVYTDSYGQRYFVVRAGETVDFRATSDVNPKILFAGLYTASFRSVVAFNDNPAKAFSIDAGPNKTQPIMVIGEKSPYITSATKEAVVGQIFDVRGERLGEDGNTKRIYIDGRAIQIGGSKGDDSYLGFVMPSVSAGQHSLQLSNAYGKSNIVYFNVDDNQAVKPVVRLSQKSLGTSDFSNQTALVPVGAEIILNWESKGADVCVASANPTTSNWSGNKSTFGLSSVGKVDKSRTYTIECSNEGGKTKSSVDVLVRGEPVPVEPSKPISTNPSPVAKCGELSVNSSIVPGQSISSCNGQYRLALQKDGNAVVYNRNNKPIWNSGTQGKVVTSLLLQNDGNLVIYGTANKALWATMKFGKPRALVIQNDGNLVIYNTSGGVIWNSGSQQISAGEAPNYATVSMSFDSLARLLQVLR